jgi:hypothetical protein
LSTGATFEAILVKRFTQEAPRVRHRRADTPAECDAAIARALQRDPADRFPSAAAFAAALGVAPGIAPRRAESSIAVMPQSSLFKSSNPICPSIYQLSFTASQATSLS